MESTNPKIPAKNMEYWPKKEKADQENWRLNQPQVFNELMGI